jgi:hypothetical protein
MPDSFRGALLDEMALPNEIAAAVDRHMERLRSAPRSAAG